MSDHVKKKSAPLNATSANVGYEAELWQMAEPTLRDIARELVASVRANVIIDWTVRENVRAQLRVLVKRILRKHGYPPDKQEKATQTVLEQAAVLSAEWATA
jgi:type I restriction enzyme R subunit